MTNPVDGPPRTGLLKVSAKRLKFFARKRRYAATLRAAGHSHVADELTDCREKELLACCSGCRNHWYVHHICNQRICPLCSHLVTRQRQEFTLQMTEHMKFPKLVTLTMPTWTDDPREGIKFLRASWNTLREDPIFKDVAGGCYVIELKPKPNGWHIHIHAVLDAPFLPFKKLRAVWGKIIHVREPIVDIRAAATPNQRAYVAKEATKAMDYHGEVDYLVAWYEATKGTRLFATFGTFYNATLEDLLNPAEAPEKGVVCPFCDARNTMFYARDGPWRYGPKLWRELRSAFLGQEDESRPIHEIVALVDQELAHPGFSTELKKGELLPL